MMGTGSRDTLVVALVNVDAGTVVKLLDTAPKNGRASWWVLRESEEGGVIISGSRGSGCTMTNGPKATRRTLGSAS